MSLAQRRTALDGVDTIPATIPEDAVLDDEIGTDGNVDPAIEHRVRRESAASTAASIPAEDGKDIWRTLSYDPFPTPEGHQLQHYESFPPETAENVAAYEVSTAKRMCEQPPPLPPTPKYLYEDVHTHVKNHAEMVKIGQIIFAVLACVLASGIVCGFAALKPVLIAEGVYRSLCPADWPSQSQIPCPEQDMRLNLFFITASITLNVSTVLAGYVLDNHGRRACYLLAAAILFLGSACMALAFALGERLPWFDGYITGNLLLGLGGTFLFVSSYQLANAFPRHAGIVVALVTGAFDASAAVFLFYRLAYEASHRAFKPTEFFSLFGVVVPLTIVAAEATFMPRSGYNTRREYQAAIAAARDPARDAHDSDDEAFAHKPRAELVRAREARAGAREARLEAIETVTGGAAARRADREVAKGRQAASGVDGILRGRPVSAQMATPWFWLLLAMTALQMTRMNYFIATVRAQYRHMLGGDEDLAARVNGFFDVALPVAGVATTPLIGVLLNEVPVWATLGVLTVLVIVMGVLNCIGRLWAGYATVVAFVLFRPLYYSAVS